MECCAAAVSIDRGCCYLGDSSGRIEAQTLTDCTPALVCQMRRNAAVRCILPADLLIGRGGDGLVIGDAAGHVVYFQGGVAVNDLALPFAVAALARHYSRDREPAIAAADVGGTVMVFGLLSQPHWRLRLQDALALTRLHLRHPAGTALLSVRAIDADGVRRRQLLVAAGGQALLRVSIEGIALDVIQAPEEVTALGDGWSSDGDDDDGEDDECDPSENDWPLAVVACAGGSIHRLPSMERLAAVGARVSAVDASWWKAHGLLACCGHFDGVLITTRHGAAQHVTVGGGGWALCARLFTAPREEHHGHRGEGTCKGRKRSANAAAGGVAADTIAHAANANVWCVTDSGCACWGRITALGIE